VITTERIKNPNTHRCTDIANGVIVTDHKSGFDWIKNVISRLLVTTVIISFNCTLVLPSAFNGYLL
jgi:hypothetical protein